MEQQQSAGKINNTEVLELFFHVLKRNPSPTYCVDVLKVFEIVLEGPNINTLLEVPNFFSWFAEDNEISIRITVKIVNFDFAKPPKQSRVVDLLLKSVDTPLVEKVIQRFL